MAGKKKKWPDFSQEEQDVKCEEVKLSCLEVYRSLIRVFVGICDFLINDTVLLLGIQGIGN